MTDVIVIGGGLAGCATAYYLAEDGVDVLLLEQGDLNTGAPAPTPAACTPRCRTSRISSSAKRGHARTFPRCDSLRLRSRCGSEPPRRLARISKSLSTADCSSPPMPRRCAASKRKAAVERAAGLPIELLDSAELRRFAPYISERMVGGCVLPDRRKGQSACRHSCIRRRRSCAWCAHPHRPASDRHSSQRRGIRSRDSGERRLTGRPGSSMLPASTQGASPQLVGASIDIQAFPCRSALPNLLRR